MKKIIYLSLILGLLILVALIYGSLKDEISFYQSGVFLILLSSGSLALILCLLLRKGASLNYWLIHLGFLTLLGGSLISFTFGYRETLNIAEGKEAAIPNTPYILRLDNFQVKYYEDSKTPKEFKSSLTILNSQKVVKQGPCRVNHPFNFKGFKFYQSGYGVREVDLQVSFKEEQKLLFKEIGDEVKIGKIKIKLLSFLPDFILKGNTATTKSKDFNNPALKLGIYSNDKLIDEGWLFLKYPQYHEKELFKMFKFESIIPRQYYSQIEVVKDPGASVVLVSSILFLTGLGRRFYFVKSTSL